MTALQPHPRLVIRGAPRLRELDKDVLEAGTANLEAQHAAARGKRADHGENAAVIFLECRLDRVLRDREPDRMPRRELLLDPGWEPIERHRHVVDALRQQLERVQVAACRLPSAVDDQHVVAELLRLSQDLRRQHQRSAAGGCAPQAIHDAALQDRIHPGRELVEEHDRRVHHEDLGDLDPPAETAAEVHHFPARLGGETELFQDPVRALADLRAAQTVEARERSEIVANGEEKLGGTFLDHDGDATADFERLGDDVAVEDGRGAGGRPRERRQDPQERRLAGAVRSEQAEDRAPLHIEREAI
jgi:hypothetical protein